MSQEMLYGMIAVGLSIVVILVLIAFELSRRQMMRVLPEAEVKIHLAILKLEDNQMNKIVLNEYQKYRRLREEKLMADIHHNEIEQGIRDAVVEVDEEVEKVKFFFDKKDIEEMGDDADDILRMVSKDAMIKNSLRNRTKENLNDNLNKFELKSEMTEEQILLRNQLIRDKVRAH